MRSNVLAYCKLMNFAFCIPTLAANKHSRIYCILKQKCNRNGTAAASTHHHHHPTATKNDNNNTNNKCTPIKSTQIYSIYAGARESMRIHESHFSQNATAHRTSKHTHEINEHGFTLNSILFMLHSLYKFVSFFVLFVICRLRFRKKRIKSSKRHGEKKMQNRFL